LLQLRLEDLDIAPFFSKIRQGNLIWWQPLMFEIRPAFEILQAENEDENHLRFSVRNNTPQLFNRGVTIKIGSRNEKLSLKIPAFSESKEIALEATNLLPGANLVKIETEDNKTIKGKIINWKIKAENSVHFETVTLAPLFNDKLTNIFQHDYLSPRSPFVSLAIPKQGIGSWVHFDEKFAVDDSGLRLIADKTAEI
jgi:hypothetical protein